MKDDPVEVLILQALAALDRQMKLVRSNPFDIGSVALIQHRINQLDEVLKAHRAKSTSSLLTRINRFLDNTK